MSIASCDVVQTADQGGRAMRSTGGRERDGKLPNFENCACSLVRKIFTTNTVPEIRDNITVSFSSSLTFLVNAVPFLLFPGSVLVCTHDARQDGLELLQVDRARAVSVIHVKANCHTVTTVMLAIYRYIIFFSVMHLYIDISSSIQALW